MGRKKIKIQPIKEDRNRSVTYLKRKAGLFKKAHELAVLTDSQVAVIVFGHNGKLAEFCSTDIDLLLLRYTEYEGAAERKGPQHYLNLDKDSDDNDADDNENDDNDNASGDGDGRDDDFSGPSGSNGGPGANGGSNGKFSGIKRKAEPASPPRKNKLALANGASPIQFGSANAAMGASPNAKQAVNAAIRRKSQGRAASIPAVNGQFAGQQVFDPLSFSHSFLANPTLPQHMVGGGLVPSMSMQPSSALFGDNMAGQGQTNAVPTNPTRAQQRVSMSIPMPSNDRLGIFVTPSTPGFGITPGGTVTTPGGRRFSFSDVLSGGSKSSTAQRPVTANSLLAPTLFEQQHDAFGLSAASQATFLSPSASPQPPHDASMSAAFAAKGAMEQGLGLDASASPFPSNANLVSRPASTGFQRSVAPTYNEATYSSAQAPSIAGSNNIASPAHIVRPVTAFANLDAPSAAGHLAPPVAGYPGSLSPQVMHVNSASPVPIVDVNATGALPTAFAAGPFASPDFKPSATPSGSQASSATPDLIQHKARGPSALGAGATSSSEEESPPSNGGKLGAAGMQPWLGMDSKHTESLVQPVPINASALSHDLSFPTNPV